MPRFYVPEPCMEGDLIRIRGNEARHIRTVLRLKPGDRLSVFDGSSKEYEGKIVKTEGSDLLVQVETHSIHEEESGPAITLAQSLLKGNKMDWVIQKATELGATEIIPFISSRTIPRLAASKEKSRQERWKRISVEACKQCGRSVLPKLSSVLEYSRMLRIPTEKTLRLFLWERSGMGLKEVITATKERQDVFFVVGPEGGWSDEEAQEASMAGFIPITLGRRILRAETVGLCILGILQYELGGLE